MPKPALVGILNITPDSFSDGGRFFSYEEAVRRAEQLFADGAAIVDIGAESTRPNATKLSHEEEWSRVEEILQTLIPRYPGRLSVDSYHPETIEKALAIGTVIVNDVTGMNNPEMIDVVVRHNATVVISHLVGADVQAAHAGELIDDVNVVKTDLLRIASLLLEKGMAMDDIILDPGIGFGKTMRLNNELLKFGTEITDFAIMVGYSKKRFLGENRMNVEPNLAAGRIARSHGARYIRVHDVQSHAEMLRE